MQNRKNDFTKTILITLLLGLVSGIIVIIGREHLINSGMENLWLQIDRFLFSDITLESNANAVGLFFIIGQIFIRLLQMLLIPLIFTSIIRAIAHIKDTSLLNQLAKKGFKNFIFLIAVALTMASIVGMFAYKAGVFQLTNIESIEIVEGVAKKSNPLLLILNAFNPNILSAFSNNGNIIAVVTLALIFGVFLQKLNGSIELIHKLVDEVYMLVMKILDFVILKISPVAIYTLLVRTFAAYGTNYLRPALAYMLITIMTLLILLYIIFPTIVYIKTGLNPVVFISKINKVAMFGFSTSSSAASLPLAQQTIIDDLGVDESVASFIVPLASTINMTGTAVMQVIATLFIASVAGYQVGVIELISILALTLIGSVSTPAAPGAGAILLFTIISGMGYSNPAALGAYSFILAINRPVEMLVTAVNVVDDSVSALTIASDLDLLDKDIYNQKSINRKMVSVNE